MQYGASSATIRCAWCAMSKPSNQTSEMLCTLWRCLSFILCPPFRACPSRVSQGALFVSKQVQVHTDLLLSRIRCMCTGARPMEGEDTQMQKQIFRRRDVPR